MTQHVRLLKNAPSKPAAWRALRSPPAANDIADSLVPLSRSLPTRPEEIAVLRATLDLTQPSELRAAAILAMLRLGLRKRELVALDVSDVVLVGSVVCVTVSSRVRRAKREQTFLPVIGADARVLKAYVTRQHDEAAALTAPLFYNIEHGRTDRLQRISANSISYWLLELRLRARQKLNENGSAPLTSLTPPPPRPAVTRRSAHQRSRRPAERA